MSKRFKKNYSIDGWPIEDKQSKTVLSTDDLVLVLNNYEQRVKELEEEDRKIKQHLKHIREIICEAAKEGFNHSSGDWPEKLFNTNQMSALILDKDSK